MSLFLEGLWTIIENAALLMRTIGQQCKYALRFRTLFRKCRSISAGCKQCYLFWIYSPNYTTGKPATFSWTRAIEDRNQTRLNCTKDRLTKLDGFCISLPTKSNSEETNQIFFPVIGVIYGTTIPVTAIQSLISHQKKNESFRNSNENCCLNLSMTTTS